jgi:transposase-like protein
MSHRDVICSVIEIMRSLAPAITEEQAQMCERAARKEWGGQRIDYIAKTCSSDRDQRRQLQGRTSAQVQKAAVADYLADKPIAEITNDHGISRRTLYRMVKR